MSGFTVLNKTYKKTHACDEPGWWKRRKLGLVEGSIIQCDECGKKHKLERGRISGSLLWLRYH